MSCRVENSNITGFRQLTPPGQVKADLPLSPRAEELVLRTRRQISDAIFGVDSRRLLVIVGPCSIHDAAAAREYASRLSEARARYGDRLLLVMRTYFEKPRTTVGWKGLINDPKLDGSCDIETGLRQARQILLQTNQLGVPCASEALDPITPQYIADLLSWASIGARTTESQTPREMASGLSMPVGFKNSTDGSLEAAVNALISAGHAHSFLGIDADGRAAVVKTNGNRNRHVVLRGGSRPNYYREDVDQAAARVAAAAAELQRPIMVDSSHGNSSKNPSRQALVCRDVAAQFADGQRAILGLLIESNLYSGNQRWSAGSRLSYGVSITDGCIGWEETEQLLGEIAGQVRSRTRAA